MSDRLLFVLAHTEARKRAAQAVAEAPEGYVGRIEPPRRNRDQNAAMQAKDTEV